MDSSNEKIKISYKIHNSKYQCHTAAMLHLPPTNLLLLAAKQEPYQNKKNLLTKKFEEVSMK